MGNGCFSIIAHRHLFPIHRVSAQGQIDGVTADHFSVDHGPVLPTHLPGFQLAHQTGMGSQGAGHHQQAAGVFIQPVDNASPGQLLQIWVKIEQRVEQGPVSVPRGGVHHQSGGLVNHKEFWIGVDQVQLQGLGLVFDLIF